MSRRIQISLIRPLLGATDAVGVISSIAGSHAAQIERKIYYPYFWYSADCAARTLFGKKALTINCLVDGRGGLGATADSFEVDEPAVPREAVMLCRTGETQARRSAQRFVTHNLARGSKTVGNFEVALESRGLVYKAFWLVRCEGAMVMVDSVTAAVHLLGERAA